MTQWRVFNNLLPHYFSSHEGGPQHHSSVYTRGKELADLLTESHVYGFPGAGADLSYPGLMNE